MAAAAPLLMIPGLICDERIFAAQLAAFAGSRAAPGHGACSSLPGMAARALAGAPERFSLLGHSMGARVALEMWRAAPERVERLALISTKVNPVKEGEAAGRYALREIGRAEGMAALVDAWLPPMIGSARREDIALVEALRTMCIEQGLTAYEAQIAALLGRPEVESLLPGIACPVLVATGAEDAWSPPDHQQAIAAAITGARLTIFERAGHMLPAESPERLNGAIAEWLARPAGA